MYSTWDRPLAWPCKKKKSGLSAAPSMTCRWPDLFRPAGRLARRLAVLALALLQVLAGGLVDHLHRQADLAAIVEAEQLHLYFVAFLDDVGHLLHPVGGKLADVDQAVLGAEEIDEGAEVHDLDDGAVIDGADLRIGGDRLDPVERRLDRLARGGCDLDGAVEVASAS